MMSRFFYSLIITFFLMMSIPVSGVAAAISASIVPGLNVTGVTAAQVTSPATAFPLLALWRPSGVTAIESYNAASGTLLRAELDTNGNPSGNNFTLVENSALYVYSTQANTLSLGASTFCSPLTLTAGFNLVGHACFPVDYSASQFITSVGIAAITSISRLDLPSGRWQTAAVDDGTIVGEDFPLTAGEGYIIQAATAVSGWKYPSLALTPTAMAVWQGQTDVALTVTIPAAAPLGGMLIDVTNSDSSLVTAASVSVPQGATSVDVPLTLPDTGISSVQVVTITAARAGMNSAQATLSVRPKPTINLSPLTTLTGLTFTYLLTVNLSDIAPPGGFPVTLASTPAGIVSVPASVTIPAGARSTQVTVTATAVGSAVISASSPGKGVTGATGAVTVTPI